ncbi:hypothetical protein [Alteribacter populi]|uniref:hypothetical protein n=1 Tax=Alteribacter populi TaxID=2011011 RepID=UPI000BBA954F|nr:hypothetical protein [Alteribacter populi]
MGKGVITVNVVTFLIVVTFAIIGMGFVNLGETPHMNYWPLYPSIVWTVALFIQQIPHLWVRRFGLAVAILSSLFCIVKVVVIIF